MRPIVSTRRHDVKIKIKENEEIELPQNESDFETLVKFIAKRYKFKDEMHVAAIIAGRIMHLPIDQAKCKLSYLVDCIKKNVSYQTAQRVFKGINQKVQADELTAGLKANPYDQKALDQLTELARESDYAKTCLSEFVDSPKSVA